MINNSTWIHQQTEQFCCCWFLVFIIQISHCSAIPLQPDLMGHESPGRYNELINEIPCLGRCTMYGNFHTCDWQRCIRPCQNCQSCGQNYLNFSASEAPIRGLVFHTLYIQLNLFVLLLNLISFGKMKPVFISS